MFTLLIVVMMLALVITLAIFITNGFRSARYHGVILILVYFGYLVFAFVVEFKLL